MTWFGEMVGVKQKDCKGCDDDLSGNDKCVVGM